MANRFPEFVPSDNRAASTTVPAAAGRRGAEFRDSFATMNFPEPLASGMCSMIYRIYTSEHTSMSFLG